MSSLAKHPQTYTYSQQQLKPTLGCPKNSHKAGQAKGLATRGELGTKGESTTYLRSKESRQLNQTKSQRRKSGNNLTTSLKWAKVTTLMHQTTLTGFRLYTYGRKQDGWQVGIRSRRSDWLANKGSQEQFARRDQLDDSLKRYFLNLREKLICKLGSQDTLSPVTLSPDTLSRLLYRAATLPRCHFITWSLYHEDTLSHGHFNTRTLYHTDT